MKYAAARRASPVKVAEAGAFAGLRSFSATNLANRIGDVYQAIARDGKAVVARYDRPEIVMLSVDEYERLVRLAEPDLGALRAEFDEMYSTLQKPGTARRLRKAFDQPAAELGEIARRAARR